MNIQHDPRNPALAQILDKFENRFDEVIAKDKGLANRHSENHRLAITACVDGLVTNQSDKVEALRKVLDAIQNRALQSAAKAKAALEEHVAITDRLDDELQHLQDVIELLAESNREP